MLTKILSDEVTCMEIGKRLGLTPDDEMKLKLSKLSVSCGMPPTTLANTLVKLCLNNPNIVEFVQQLYNKEPAYRVKASIDGDKCIYESAAGGILNG